MPHSHPHPPICLVLDLILNRVLHVHDRLWGLLDRVGKGGEVLGWP